MQINENFFGVYSPKGELEAVEISSDIAFESALNLSPKVDGKIPHKPNRTVEHVTIIRGTFEQFKATYGLSEEPQE